MNFFERLIFALALSIVILGAWIDVSFADTRVALVIGNDAYQSAPRLPNPPNAVAPPTNPADLRAAAQDHSRSADAIGTIEAYDDHLSRVSNWAFADLARAWLAERLRKAAKRLLALAASVAPGDKSKGDDRVGQQAPVAPRAVLYEEEPGNPRGLQYTGQVAWRIDQVGSANGQPSDIAIRADIEIPDRKFKMTFLIRRNNDTSLPASHTAELTFILPPDFPGGGIDNVPGILMKSNEQARGVPLAGLSVKVTDGFFLVGLQNVDADRVRNIQLLKERSWFDIPVVYANKQRAIIAIEKGASGERAFNIAFANWDQSASSATR